MNRKERKKNFISKYLDTKNTRMKDDEVNFLCKFINEYDDKYKGKTKIKKSSYNGWNSYGKYIRWKETTFTFTDDVGINEEYRYNDDDGQKRGNSNKIKDAIGIINWFKKKYSLI